MLAKEGLFLTHDDEKYESQTVLITWLKIECSGSGSSNSDLVPNKIWLDWGSLRNELEGPSQPYKYIVVIFRLDL